MRTVHRETEKSKDALEILIEKIVFSSHRYLSDRLSATPNWEPRPRKANILADENCYILFRACRFFVPLSVPLVLQLPSTYSTLKFRKALHNSFH